MPPSTVKDRPCQGKLAVTDDYQKYASDLPGSVDFGKDSSLGVLKQLRGTDKIPLFSLMIVLEQPAPGQVLDNLGVLGSDTLQWLSRDTAKPGQPQ